MDKIIESIDEKIIINNEIIFPACYDESCDICRRGKSSGTGSPLNIWCPDCAYNGKYTKEILDQLKYCKKHGTILYGDTCPNCFCGE